MREKHFTENEKKSSHEAAGLNGRLVMDFKELQFSTVSTSNKMPVNT